MASLNGFVNTVSGTTGTANTVEPKSGWFVYVMPRGMHASAASTGTLITVDSANAASRVSANQWVQVGIDTSKIVQVSAVGGNSFSVNSSVTVAQNDRILVIGNTQPTVTGGSASYQPHTTIYPRDDDGSTPTANSVVTTSSDGLYQFWKSDGLNDLLFQDNNRANVGILADVQIGIQPTSDFTPITSAAVSLGTCALPFNNLYLAGKCVSGITSAAGRTYFDYRTCEGVTQGNLFAFGISNQAPKVYGDTHGGVYQSYTLPEVFNVKSARFGAKGDGTTDDTTAISNAITAATGASDGAGGIVFLPPGIYIVNSALTITSRVRLVGSGDRITVLKAGGSFTFNGSTDAVVKISGASDNYAALEHIQIDCNNVASSIGIYMSDCHELSGPRNCEVVRYRLYGIDIDTNSQNVSIERCNFFFSASSTTAIGIRFNGVDSRNSVQNCTFNSYDGATNSSGEAITMVGSNVDLFDIHVEHHGNGTGNAAIRYDANSSGVCIGIYGHSTVTTLLEIGNGVAIFNAIHNSGTNLIGDRVSGTTVTSAGGANSGWYLRSNDGGATTKDLWTSVPYTQNYHGAPTTHGTTNTFPGTVVGSSFTILTAGTVLTLSAGNLFGLSTAPAGTTTVTSITPLTEGREITLIGWRGTATFSNVAGQQTGAPAVAPNEAIKMVCIGSTWHQITPKF